jgi:hypothetical protein
MSAAELLKQVSKEFSKLSADEREKFVDGVLDLEGTASVAEPASTGTALKWPDIEARHRRIFGKSKLPVNLVLEAREEEDH